MIQSVSDGFGYLGVGRFFKGGSGQTILYDSAGFSYSMEAKLPNGRLWACNFVDKNGAVCPAKAVTRSNKIIEWKSSHHHLPSKEYQFQEEEEIGKLVTNVGRGSFHFIDRQGFKYFKDNEFPGHKYAWRCSMKKRLKCKARLRTIGSRIYGRSNEHNHGPEFGPDEVVFDDTDPLEMS